MSAPVDAPTPASPAEELLLLRAFVVAVAAFLLVRGAVAGLGVPGVALAEWAALLGLPALLLRLRSLDPWRSVRVRIPTAREAAGAVFLGLAGLPVAWTVFWLQSPWISVDPAVAEALQQELLPSGPGAFVLLVLLAVVTPAVCEEYALRGLLLEGIRRRWGAGWAVGGSALVFGVLHASPGAASRILPTAALGVLLGWAVWRSGTLLAGVLVHLTHNLLILASTAVLGRLDGPAAGPPGGPPAPFLLAGVVFLALGAHLLDRRRGDSPAPDPEP